MIIAGFEALSARIQTVSDLLRSGHFVRVGSDTIKANEVIIKTLFDNTESLIGIATFKKDGDMVIAHKHLGIIQYLILYRGKISIVFGDGGYRILNVGDCARIDSGQLHTLLAMKDDSELLFACIPAEPGYKIDNSILDVEKSERIL